LRWELPWTDCAFLVMGLGFFGKHWLKEIASCSECEVAGVVAKHPDLLAWAGEEFQDPGVETL